jgi:hypothetical protein
MSTQCIHGRRGPCQRCASQPGQAPALYVPPAADEGKHGPAMAALPSPRMRQFVLYLADGMKQIDAYRAAGYAPSSQGSAEANASLLAHDERVQAACSEEHRRRFNALLPLARIVVEETLQSSRQTTTDENGRTIPPNRKLGAHIALALMDRNGFGPQSQHTVTVEHVSDEAKIARIVALAKSLDLDPTKLLGQAGIVIDADFTIVPRGAAQ